MFIKSICISIPLLLVLLITKPASAADDYRWSKTDMSLQAGFVVLTVMDWRQTRELTKNRSKYGKNYTCNPLLDTNPTAREANVAAGASLIIHTSLAYIIPRPYRTVWQSFWIGVQGGAVLSNYVAGISVRF